MHSRHKNTVAATQPEEKLTRTNTLGLLFGKSFGVNPTPKNGGFVHTRFLILW